MLGVIGELLPLAVGIALSSFPIAVAILLLFGKHARSNGLAFLAGWSIALAGAASLNETPKTPGWMATIDSFSAVKSFGLTLLIGGLLG